MISFNVSPLFVLDLRDDFLMNSNEKLYEFIGKDPVKAFHLGIYVSKWFGLLDRKQQYLHSKSLRHIREDIKPYLEQIKHWTSAFPQINPEGQVNMIDFSEYVFSNMVWNPETEDQDKVKVALFLGMTAGENVDLSNEQLIFGIQ